MKNVILFIMVVAIGLSSCTSEKNRVANKESKKYPTFIISSAWVSEKVVLGFEPGSFLNFEGDNITDDRSTKTAPLEILENYTIEEDDYRRPICTIVSGTDTIRKIDEQGGKQIFENTKGERIILRRPSVLEQLTGEWNGLLAEQLFRLRINGNEIEMTSRGHVIKDTFTMVGRNKFIFDNDTDGLIFEFIIYNPLKMGLTMIVPDQESIRIYLIYKTQN